MRIELPTTPPTTNTIWRRAGVRFYLTPAGRQFRDAVALIARGKWQGPPSKKRMRMQVILEFADKRIRDIDNYHKVLGDALAGVVYENDTQVDDLHITKTHGNKLPRTIINIQEI